MKNGIIALLFLLVVFLLLYVLGAFNYGSITDHDYNGAFLSTREEAVSKSPVWKVGIALDLRDGMGRETVRGIQFARDYLNSRGGILGKHIELEIHGEATSPQQNKLLTQEFCERPDIALLIGGLNTEEIPTLRSITQFQGLPFVSPVASLPDSLPELKPDMTFSYFPPLSILTNKLATELARRGKKRLLVVSPGDDSYGSIFGTKLERRLHEDKSFVEIYRVNFKNPARFADLYQSLKLFTENRTIDAIIFTDDEPCLKVLGEVIKALNISIEVWGNDYLDITHSENSLKAFPCPIFYTAFGNCRFVNKDFIKAWQEKFGSPPSLWNQLGAQCLLGFAEAVERESKYKPGKIIDIMRELHERKLALGKVPTEVNIRQMPRGKQ